MHGAHTVFPMFGVDIPEFAHNYLGRVRDFIVVTDEAIQKECLEGRQMVWFVDITTETKPFGVASWTVPETKKTFVPKADALAHTPPTKTLPPFIQKNHVFCALQCRGEGLRCTQPHEPRRDRFLHSTSKCQYRSAWHLPEWRLLCPLLKPPKRRPFKPTTLKLTNGL
jgi:hypothetical protein